MEEKKKSIVPSADSASWANLLSKEALPTRLKKQVNLQLII